MKNNLIHIQSNEQLIQLRQEKFLLYNQFETKEILLQGKSVQVRKGFTLTPFANPQACNAHCRFCSEELLLKGRKTPSSKEFIKDFDIYFKRLNRVLNDLSSLEVRLSISGLEATQNSTWLMGLLQCIHPFSNIVEKVLYTNGSGLVHTSVVDALFVHGINKIELSRSHFDQKINQAIMYFNRNVAVLNNTIFEQVLTQTGLVLPLKVSCILNKKGISTLESVIDFIKWLLPFGVKEIVFRELSILHPSLQRNDTSKWIEDHRVRIDSILHKVIESSDFSIQHVTSGYYYYNEVYSYKGSCTVIFETSNYEVLEQANTTSSIHKLIFHANGNLTTSWDNSTNVVARYE